MPETFEFSILSGKIIQPLFGRISHSLARQVSTAGKKICQITNISRQYAPPTQTRLLPVTGFCFTRPNKKPYLLSK